MSVSPDYHLPVYKDLYDPLSAETGQCQLDTRQLLADYRELTLHLHTIYDSCREIDMTLK